MEGVEKVLNQEKKRDEFLNLLWYEYGFPGKPPFADSVGEQRLKEACNNYADYVGHYRRGLPGDEKTSKGVRGLSSSEDGRRSLHNQIALMVTGRQRSGMDVTEARHIANFAYEYSKGVKVEEVDKYKG